MEELKCSKCGNKLSDNDKFCPQCGSPIVVESTVEKTEEVKVTEVSEETKKELKKSKTVLIVVVAVVGLLLCGTGIYFYAFKNVKDYKSRYESLAINMLTSGAEAEKCGNLIYKVWYNSIFKVDDSETDKYTKTLGSFNTDFNTSLRNLFSDSSFSSRISKIKEEQVTFKKEMDYLKNPSKDWKKPYSDMQRFYNDYVEFTNLIVSPDGSLTSFGVKFKQYDTNMVTSYKNLKQHLSW